MKNPHQPFRAEDALPPAPPLQRVTIYLDRDNWMLDHADDPSAADVRALFDTTVLPMPYRRPTIAPVVMAVLRKLHPGVLITRGLDR